MTEFDRFDHIHLGHDWFASEGPVGMCRTCGVSFELMRPNAKAPTIQLKFDPKFKDGKWMQRSPRVSIRSRVRVADVVPATGPRPRPADLVYAS